jgi:DUF2934 family protein
MNMPEQFPTQEQIAKRAHQFYLERGGSHGKDKEDWLQAELQLTMEMYLEQAARPPIKRGKLIPAQVDPLLSPDQQQESKLTTEVEKGS